MKCASMQHDFLPKILLKAIEKNSYTLLELHSLQSGLFGTVWKLMVVLNKGLIFTGINTMWMPRYQLLQPPFKMSSEGQVLQSGSLDIISCLVHKRAWKTLRNT